MARIVVHPPEGSAPEQVALGDGEALVIGRDPAADAHARRLVVASPRVSSSHVLVRRAEGAVHVRDLNSKNGTYLRLERGGEVRVEGPSDVRLFLAVPQPTAASPTPRHVGAKAVDARSFAEDVRDAIAAWLTSAGHAARVRVVSADPASLDPARPAPEVGGPFTIPLVEGLALELSDDAAGRTQAQWDGLKAELYPYAHAQVADWRAVRTQARGRALAFGAAASERALREVLEAARARVPLVLTGESGTGKTELAAIYGGADARGRDGEGPPFITVHCAHVDAPLAHSLLFGAAKGSYTSADRTIVGAVGLAHGGVLFLGDVDALPLEVQAKLLRFLDQGLYEPLGHGQSRPLHADVRVVTGSAIDLRAAVRERRFREDLYWRLHLGAVVRVPPLRERPEDVEQLLGPVRARLDAGALHLLLHQHAWRGNFRECLRFVARVRMEPGGALDRARAEAILAEASLEPDAPPASTPPAAGARASADEGVFERALREALASWRALEPGDPVRFDELHRFCEAHLKSTFVAHALGLEAADARPETFDRDARQRLGCDLSTLKRKVDDYLALRARTRT